MDNFQIDKDENLTESCNIGILDILSFLLNLVLINLKKYHFTIFVGTNSVNNSTDLISSFGFSCFLLN